MTPAQIELVRRTWREQLLPQRAAAAALFYARLFEIAPEVRPMFVRDIHAQGAKLMAMLDQVVGALDRPEVVLPAAEQLARRHVAYGVVPRHYDAVGTALVWTIEQGLGSACTPPVLAAWIAAWRLLSQTMRRAAYPDAAADAHAAAGVAVQG